MRACRFSNEQNSNTKTQHISFNLEYGTMFHHSVVVLWTWWYGAESSRIIECNKKAYIHSLFTFMTMFSCSNKYTCSINLSGILLWSYWYGIVALREVFKQTQWYTSIFNAVLNYRQKHHHFTGGMFRVWYLLIKIFYSHAMNINEHRYVMNTLLLW